MTEYRDDFDISTDEEESLSNSKKRTRKIDKNLKSKVNPLQIKDDSEKFYKKDYKVPIVEKPIVRIWQYEIEKILAIRYGTIVKESGEKIINKNKRECLLKFVGQSYRSIAWEDEKDVLEDTTGAYKHKLFVRMKAKKDEPLCVGEDFLFEHVVDLEWFDCERIVSSKMEDVIYETETLQEEVFLVKWKGLPYNESTWEFIAELEDNEIEIQHYRDSQTRLLNLVNNIPSKKTAKIDPNFNKLANLKTLFESGVNLSVDEIPVIDIVLRDYQVEAVNWLLYMYVNNRSCILADEMGLGKTIQSCSFLETIREKEYSNGVSMVIAPLSTIKFWQSTFAENTKSNVVLFYGSAEERNFIKDYEFSENPNYDPRKKNNGDLGLWLPHFNVMITTYEVCQNDATFLKKFNWDVVVIDEAHRLKNNKTQIRTTLMEFNIKHKVLLTGTPIQNNMAELFSLLEFMAPNDFKNRDDFISKYTDMQTETQVKEVQEILRKYMLRREKKDVEILLPKKIETIIDVELTAYQKQYYRAILEKNRKFLMRGKLKKVPQLLNVLSELRKVCNHPFLVVGGREHYFEEQLHQKQLKLQQANSISGPSVVEEELVDMTDPINYDPLIFCSGKIVLLHKLLIKLKAEGSKALIFSQFTSTLDLIQEFLTTYDYEYERIDGTITGRSRFAAMKRFNAEDSKSLVFLLTTRAGGIGLNLQSANTVIIFDSDWNPQGDHQAIARSHRMGQKKEVKVYRLLSKKTAEQELFKAANLKLGLTNVLLNGLNNDKTSKDGPKDERSIDDILKNGAFELLAEDEATSLAQSKKFMTDNIDLILETNSKEITYTDEGYVSTLDYEKKLAENENEDKKEKSLFSQVSFVSDKTSENISLDDLDFWEKALPTGTSRLSRLKRVYDEENVINLKNDINYSRETLISILKIAEEINNHRQAGELSDETEEIVELLTILISSNLYTPIENEILSLRMSIEQPKRHRASNTGNSLLSEEAIKKLNDGGIKQKKRNNKHKDVHDSSGDEEVASDTTSDNSMSYNEDDSDKADDGESHSENSDGDGYDESIPSDPSKIKRPHYTKTRRTSKKLTEVEIETNNVIKFLLNDLDPKTDQDQSSKEQVSGLQLFAATVYYIFKEKQPNSSAAEFRKFCHTMWENMSSDRRQVHINRGSDFNNVINEARLKDAKENIDISKALKVLLGSTREKFIKLSKEKSKNPELGELYSKKNKIVKEIESIITEQKKNVQLLIARQKEKYESVEKKKHDQIAGDSDLTEDEIEDINAAWNRNREALIESFKQEREMIKMHIEQELVEKKKYEHQLNLKISEMEEKIKLEKEENEKKITKQNKSSFLSTIGVSQSKISRPPIINCTSEIKGPTSAGLTDTQLTAFEKVQAFRNAQDKTNDKTTVSEKRHRQLDQFDIDKKKKMAKFLSEQSSTIKSQSSSSNLTEDLKVVLKDTKSNNTIETKNILMSTNGTQISQKNIPPKGPITAHVQNKPNGLEYPLPVIGSMFVANTIVYSIDMYAIFESGPFAPVEKFGATITQKTEGYSLISSLSTPHPNLRGCMQSFKNDLIVQANGVDVIGFSLDEIHRHFTKISNSTVTNRLSSRLVLLVRRFFSTESGAQNFLVGNDMSCYNENYSSDYGIPSVAINNSSNTLHQERLARQPHPQRYQPEMIHEKTHNIPKYPVVPMNTINSINHMTSQQSHHLIPQQAGSNNNRSPSNNSNQQHPNFPTNMPIPNNFQNISNQQSNPYQNNSQHLNSYQNINSMSNLSSNSYPQHMQQKYRNMQQINIPPNMQGMMQGNIPPNMQLPLNIYPQMPKPGYMPIPLHNHQVNNPVFIEMMKEQKRKNLYFVGVWLSNYMLSDASSNAGPRPDQHQQIIIFKDKNWHNKWPLHYAAMIGDLALIRQYASVIDGVQKIDPNLQMTDWYNSSPLSWASGFGQLKAVMLLISLGAVYTGLSNAMGFNPKSDALREGHMHIVTFLDDFEKAMARNFV